MAKKFDIGDFAKTLAQPVPESDTGREQIEYISVDLLDDDPNNFYSLRDLDELAANIATVGLQQPIRVRDGENGHVVIVSGHRRTAAIRMLVADGRDDLREVPCLRERGEVSPALQELRLLYANSSTRALTSAEISRQVERVRELLYQLKEEGYEFPGRMRDHVAEACKISKSKLARLEKIQKGLASCYRDAWEAGTLPEDAADALSSLPEYVQERVKRVCPKTTPSAGRIRDAVKRGEYLAVSFKCPDGSTCTHMDKFFRHDLKAQSWEACGGEKCCLKCRDGGAHDPSGFCGAACAEMCSKAREKYEKAKEKKKASDAAAEMKAQSEAARRVQAESRRVVRAADAAGLGDEVELHYDYGGSLTVGLLRSLSDGTAPDSAVKFYSRGILPWRADDVAKNAKTLRCSVDYLLGLTDEINSTAAVSGQTVLSSWMPGGTTPAEPCDVVADVDLGAGGGETMRMTCCWNGREFCVGKKREPIDMAVVRWIALPPVEKEDENDD
jgi:ParB family chromosome partitioning protein|nr:MAG TPA: chromosome partitioning protein [Caudoviricetes sp.]